MNLKMLRRNVVYFYIGHVFFSLGGNERRKITGVCGYLLENYVVGWW